MKRFPFISGVSRFSKTFLPFASKLNTSSRLFASTESKDYYKILGVARGADQKDIKKAYRKRALETHPDQGGKKEEFSEVAEAYEILSNPEKRAIYEQYGSEAAQQHGGPGDPNAFHRSAEDVFAEFFRGGMGGFGFPSGKSKKNVVSPIETNVRLTLEEVFTGCTKHVNVYRPSICGDCRGSGTKSQKPKPKCTACNGVGHIVKHQRLGPGMVQQSLQTCSPCRGTGIKSEKDDECVRCTGKGYRELNEKISVQIQPGVPSDVTLVYPGEGGTIPDAQPGDLHVHVEVLRHQTFSRRGNDLVLEQELTLSEALLGLTIPLRLLDKRLILVQTPKDAVLRENNVIKVSKEGLPGQNGTRGDIFIYLTVNMPKHLTNTQKEAIETAFGKPSEGALSSGTQVKGELLPQLKDQFEEKRRKTWASQGGDSQGAKQKQGSRSTSDAECVHQ